ncbi:MAG: efflux RND transporter periplasmic adaptor subunit [Gemmatimonadaceae bacterium]
MMRAEKWTVPGIAMAAIVVVVAAAGCAKPAPPPKPPVAVTVATSERGPAPYVVAANGVVEPLQSVAVQSQVGGVLAAVRFREGDEVQKGQLLFEIDPRPYESALKQSEAALARDQAQADNARRDAERFANLAQKDFVTKSQADQAQANADALRAVLESDKAAVANARFNLENASIRAPVSGKTGSLFVRLGNLVKPGAEPPLVIINQIRPILVRFTVSDRELPLVQRYARGSALKVSAVPATGDTTPIVGKLSFVDNGVDTTTGTLTLKGEFENSDNRLWPGQFVRASVELYVEPNAVMVPSEAVQTSQEGTFVFVVDDKGTAAMRPVRVGRAIGMAGEKTSIDSGLVEGLRVITDGQAKLAPGSRVEVKASHPPSVTAARSSAP